ncbi:MAG: TonB-dependent receptor [Gemmatimonadetes bacterium]|nr:TonB-dependent receptor [Gemmatimonadota bacterium]
MILRRAVPSLVGFALSFSLAPASPAQGIPADSIPIPIPAVTVTVLRTPLEIGRAPYAIAVNDETRIQRGQPGLGLDEALRGIPGVQVDNRYNFAVGERISIRGFGARAQFGVRGVRVLVDGIPATLPDGQTALSHVDLSTVTRAEVIRGPASALYGNTAGGVIQLETSPPPDATIGQEFRVLGGSNGLLRLHSSTGGTSGAASYLLNASRLAYGGFRDFSSGRNLYLGGRLGYQGARDDLRLVFSAVDSDAQNPGSLSLALLEEDRSQAFANNKLQQTGKQAREGQAGARWRRQMDATSLESVIYGIRREVVNPIPNVIIDLDRAAFGGRSVLQSATGSNGWLRWGAGVEADRQRDERRNFGNVRGERGTLRLDQLEHVTNLAGFAQLTAVPLERLTMLAGLRYDWFRFDVTDFFVTATNPDDSGSRTLDAVSPSIGANYRLIDQFQLYGNVGTSFETPTTTELANRPDGAGGFNPLLEPQRAFSMEVGAQGRLNARMVYQLAVYRAHLRNSLIPFEVPEAAGRQFFRNAGSAVHRGVEAGVTLMPLPFLRMDGAYTYTDARFRRYSTANNTFDGNRVPGIAPHRLDISATIERPRGGWFVTAEVRHLSEIPVDDANSASSPAYSLLDVRAGTSGVHAGRVSIAPFVGIANILNAEYNTAVAVNAFGQRFYEPGPGRSAHLGSSLRFVTRR